MADIVSYIAKDLKEPAIAQKLYAKIISELIKLESMPERHALAIDAHLRSLGVRPFYIDNYIAPYTISIEENMVFILRVLYARRDWKKLL